MGCASGGNVSQLGTVLFPPGGMAGPFLPGRLSILLPGPHERVKREGASNSAYAGGT